MGRAKAKQHDYRVGDVFAFRVGADEFGFGRILLDIDRQCKRPRRIDASSALWFGNQHTILVELFTATSTAKHLDIAQAERLIPGVFTSNIDLLLGYWEVVGHEPVDPREVDFPESLSHKGAFHGHFVKGEVRLSVELSHEDVEAIGVYRTELASAELSDVFLYAKGRASDIVLAREQLPLRDIARHDLRFSAHRERVYALLPDDLKQPYYAMASARGLDLARFYD